MSTKKKALAVLGVVALHVTSAREGPFTPTSAKKKTLAVLGGGPASLATVWSITNKPGWRDDFESITVYQLGWRLGGKCATGRSSNPLQGNRIEEHGYHELFGFYENTFEMLRSTFAEYGRRNTLPISECLAAKAEDEKRYPRRYAFHRDDFVTMQQQLKDGKWYTWQLKFPRNSYLPGDGEGMLPSPLAYVEYLIQFVLNIFKQLQIEMKETTRSASSHAAPDWFLSSGETSSSLTGAAHSSGELNKQNPDRRATGAFQWRRMDGSSWWNDLKSLEDKAARSAQAFASSFTTLGSKWMDPMEFLMHIMKVIDKYKEDLGDKLSDPKEFKAAIDVMLQAIALLVQGFLKGLWRLVMKDVETNWNLYRLWTTADFIGTIIIGSIKDNVLWNGFDSIDRYNFWEWLVRHQTVRAGMQVTLHSPWVRNAYSSSFAYAKGDMTSPPRSPGKPFQGDPQAGAGCVIRGGSRLVPMYKGAMGWKFQAGCADILCAPLYEVLKKRGVKFVFFHKVKKLSLDPTNKSLIAKIEMEIQATLRDDVKEYNPLIHVKGVPCWPGEPRYEQLTQGNVILEGGYNLESAWTDWRGIGTKILELGKDYTDVLLGIPVSCLNNMTQELKQKSTKWRNMCDKLQSVRTQALQCWMTKDLKGLGWWRNPSVVSIVIKPLDTWGDCSQTLPAESWDEAVEKKDEGSGESSSAQKLLPPKSIAYFCAAFADDPNEPPPAPADVKYPSTQRKKVLAYGVDLFERHSGHFWPDANKANKGFEWNLMTAPDTLKGSERLDYQYIRANIDPHERYILSIPGTNQYRLSADVEDFKNLYICGDWTSCGLSIGCVEAAVTSGFLASRAIVGYPQKVIGEFDFPWQ